MDVEPTGAPANDVSLHEGDSWEGASAQPVAARRPFSKAKMPASLSIERAAGRVQPLLTSRLSGAARDAELLLLRLDRVSQVLARVDHQLVEVRKASDDLQAARPRREPAEGPSDPTSAPADIPSLPAQPSRFMHYTARLHNFVAWQLLRVRVAIDSLVWQLKANH